MPNIEVDKSDKFFTHWDPDSKTFSLQVPFKSSQEAKPQFTPAAPLSVPGITPPA